MKQRIRLTESQLHQVVRESVMNVLNEISYPKVRGAYNKMREKGQYIRSNQLARTYHDLYNKYDDDNTIMYDIPSDRLYFKNNIGFCRDKGTVPTTFSWQWSEANDSWDDLPLEYRVSNPRVSRMRANAYDNFAGNPKGTTPKDAFRK